MSSEPTDEQKKAINYRGNAVVTARPGSGKTFTLARMIAQESRDLLSYQGIIAISYTNKASDELETRCRRLGVPPVRSFFGTIDRFCVSQIVMPFMSHLAMKSSSIELIADDDCAAWKAIKGRAPNDTEMASFIKRSLLTGEIPIGALCVVALYILDTVPQASIYLKARYTSVFVDEYQDCGLHQHLLVKRLVSYGLRAVAVGDLDQAIYQYDGKSPEYLCELVKSHEFEHFEITENHRCDKAIQAYSLALLGKKVDPVERKDRRVFAVHMRGDETVLAAGIRTHLQPIMEKYGVGDRNKVAIIGSSNRVLDCFSRKIGITNKRYVGTPLDKGLSKWRPIFADLLSSYYDPNRFSGAFLDRHIGIYAKTSTRNRGLMLLEEFFSTREDELVSSITTAIQIARLCEPNGERDGDVEAYRRTVESTETLRNGFCPARNEEINILTYHKAKGLEFDVVFCLEAYQYVMPPYKYWERDYDAYGQSLAMHYVGITRAKKVCYILMGTKRHKSGDVSMDASTSEFLFRPGLQDLRNDTWWC